MNKGIIAMALLVGLFYIGVKVKENLQAQVDSRIEVIDEVTA